MFTNASFIFFFVGFPFNFRFRKPKRVFENISSGCDFVTETLGKFSKISKTFYCKEKKRFINVFWILAPTSIGTWISFRCYFRKLLSLRNVLANASFSLLFFRVLSWTWAPFEICIILKVFTFEFYFFHFFFNRNICNVLIFFFCSLWLSGRFFGRQFTFNAHYMLLDNIQFYRFNFNVYCMVVDYI